MGPTLRAGIAGMGVVGRRRREFIARNPRLRTVAVCDRDFEHDGREIDGVRHFAHYGQLLAQELDVLFVCLPNELAAEVTIAGLERGLHVLCEKPPGRDVSDVSRVIACEARHPGLKLKYGFNHRYHDSVRDALALARSGELGPLVDLRGLYGKSSVVTTGQASDWRSQRGTAGGGILLDQGIHMVDLMRLFAGEFEQVHSFVRNDFWNHDVEDNAYALMRTRGGVVGMLHSSATQWRHQFSLDLTFHEGAIRLGGFLTGTRSYGAETLTVARRSGAHAGDPREQTTRYNHDPSWEAEIDDFARAILEDRPVENGSSEDALRTMELVYRIYRADPEWREKWNLGAVRKPARRAEAAA